jgi:hypothetical protein
MSFSKEVSKLLTNKYFLYFMVFLASTNMLGYLVTNKLNALIFFALVGLITFQFSKNMAVVLLVAIIATNFLMSTNLIREGLENQSTDNTSNTNSNTSKKDTNMDSSSNDTSNSLTNNTSNNTSNDSSIDSSNESSNDSSNNMDINNKDLNKKIGTNDEPEGVVQSANIKGKTEEHFGPRLDYAATIEQSYQNLDQLLGSDSIKQLTTDTQKLMAQQQNLFNTMNQMAPVLEGATTMLKTFDIKSLTESLKNISPMKNAPMVSLPKN